MKNLLISVVLLAGLSGTAFAAEQTVTLAVEKMYCALCPITVSKAIERVEGVSAVHVDFENKTAVVTYDDAGTDWQSLADASANAGYPATLVSE